MFLLLSNSWVKQAICTPSTSIPWMPTSWQLDMWKSAEIVVDGSDFRVYIYTYIMDRLYYIKYYSILARTSTKKYIDDNIHFHPTGHIPKMPTCIPLDPKTEGFTPPKNGLTYPQKMKETWVPMVICIHIYIYIFRNYLYIFLT